MALYTTARVQIITTKSKRIGNAISIALAAIPARLNAECSPVDYAFLLLFCNQFLNMYTWASSSGSIPAVYHIMVHTAFLCVVRRPWFCLISDLASGVENEGVCRVSVVTLPIHRKWAYVLSIFVHYSSVEGQTSSPLTVLTNWKYC